MAGVSYNGPDRRQFKRLKEAIPVRIRLISEAGEYKTEPPYHGITENISASGIFLKIPFLMEKEKLSVGDRVELEIDLPTPRRSVNATGRVVRFVVEVISPEGEVRWVGAKKPMQVYKVGAGIKFVEISDEERNKIASFIEAKL